MGTRVTVVVAIVLIAAFSVGTGLVVHRNDQTSTTHAIMVSNAMQKAAIKRAETIAAMKQEQSDEMSMHNSMMNNTSSTDGMSSTH